MSEEKYLTIKELTLLAETPYATIRRDIDANILPAYKVGRKYFVAPKDAHAYAEKKIGKKNLHGYTIKEIMDIIPLSYAFIIELIKSGRLPAEKSGRQYIVKKDDFADFLEEMKLT